MGLLSFTGKVILSPFYLVRRVVASPSYREYLDRKKNLHSNIRKIRKERSRVQKQEQGDPEKLQTLNQREKQLRRAVRELARTYRSQRRLDQKPDSMGRFRAEKRREKKLRKAAGKVR